jgi:phage terminase large subunit-like protein
MFEAGNVYLPDPSIAPWVHDYIEELVKFPNSGDSDQVDMTTQALDDLRVAHTERSDANEDSVHSNKSTISPARGETSW